MEALANKICICCSENKGIEEFYSHPRMVDGRVNKCKNCCRRQSKERGAILRGDDNWIMKERARGREKYHRLGYKNKAKVPKEIKRTVMDKYWHKYPEKRMAKNSAQTIRVGPNLEGHHWSYNKQHWKDLIALTVAEHNKLHRYIKYDQTARMYKTIKGTLLDTKERHLRYFSLIKNLP